MCFHVLHFCEKALWSNFICSELHEQADPFQAILGHSPLHVSPLLPSKHCTNTHLHQDHQLTQFTTHFAHFLSENHLRTHQRLTHAITLWLNPGIDSDGYQRAQRTSKLLWYQSREKRGLTSRQAVAYVFSSFISCVLTVLTKICNFK